jgi:hypothetical protein
LGATAGDLLGDHVVVEDIGRQRNVHVSEESVHHLP